MKRKQLLQANESYTLYLNLPMRVCKYFRFTAAALLADASHHPQPYCKYNFFQHKVYLAMESGRQPAVAAVVDIFRSRR